MIAFKEYVNLSFQYIIAERVKNSLFFYFGTPKDFLKFFNFSPDFLDGLDDTTGTSFFIAEQEKIQKPFTEEKINLVNQQLTPFEFFEKDLEFTGNKDYYDLAFYYLKESGLTKGMTKINLSKSKKENSRDAALEFFSHELYKIAKEVHKDISESDYEKMKDLEYDEIKNYSLSKLDNNKTLVNFKFKKTKVKRLISTWTNVYSRITIARDEMSGYLDENLISLIDNA